MSTLQCLQVPKERLEKFIEAYAVQSAHDARNVARWRSRSGPPEKLDEDSPERGRMSMPPVKAPKAGSTPTLAPRWKQGRRSRSAPVLSRTVGWRWPART
jgi:hypothetical protein